jgi:hypothetical protein
MASPLDNATIETTPQPLTPEPVVPVNQPEAAVLPPPLPQLQAGEIPAILVPPITQEMVAADPAIDAIVSAFPKLGDLGLEYYEATDLSSVIYNPSKVTEADLKEAEQNGTLASIAQPLQALEAAQGSGAAPGDQMAPLAAEQLPAPPPAGEARLQSARVQNMAPKQISPIQPRPVTTGLAKRAI